MITICFEARLVILALLLIVTCPVRADIACQVKVFQDQQEVPPSRKAGPVLLFDLRAKEFQVEVLPAVCYPSIATIPKQQAAIEIAEKPLIYSHRWSYLVAATAADADKLLWWPPVISEPEFTEQLRAAPAANTFDGKQFQQLCDELKFCPNTYLFSPVRLYSTS